MKDSKASHIAKGGMITALTIIILYAGNIITVNTFFLLGIACALIPLCVLITDVRTATVVYGSSAVLAFLIIPDKLICLYYVLFFGPYGLIKLIIEKKDSIVMEIILKLAYYNATLVLGYILYTNLFAPNIDMKLPIFAVILVANIAFIILDYTLTVFSNYIKRIYSK